MHWRALRESNPCFRRERAASWTARRRAQPTRQRRCGKGATYKGLCRGGQATPTARYRRPSGGYQCHIPLDRGATLIAACEFSLARPTPAYEPQIAWRPRAGHPAAVIENAVAFDDPELDGLVALVVLPLVVLVLVMLALVVLALLSR